MQGMFQRSAYPALESSLQRQAGAVLLGPRQVGKTTMARAMAAQYDAVYLDLEQPSDAQVLAEPELFLAGQGGRLVILDEIQRRPDLFPILRGQIDARRAAGQRVGQFLLLGSASRDLLMQSSESLAGRVSYLELTPLMPFEVPEAVIPLWLRGGFPEAFQAANDRDSLMWRDDFIRTYLERDIPAFGLRIPSETLRRFWTMLAHVQGAQLNASRLAAGLGVSGQSVARYLDLLVDLMLVRRLEPWHANVGKRLVKSPKIYVRDSGLVHALLRLETEQALLGHPVVGGSWEGFCIEALIAAAPRGTDACYYRDAAGAEIDLVLTLPGGAVWGIEIKRTVTPKQTRGYQTACETIGASEQYFVYSGTREYPLSATTTALPLLTLTQKLSEVPLVS